MKLLVVDDSATQRSLIRVFLSGHGFDFVEAKDGAQGLALAQSSDDIDLVVTDMRMPELNGVQLIRKLRSSAARSRRVPIVALTAERDTIWLDQAMSAGADAFCHKPVSQVDLLAVVRRLLRLDQRRSLSPRA